MTLDDDKLASLHPLLAGLFTRHGYTPLDAAGIDAFADAPGHAMLMFIDDPVRLKETLDLAVIVPELARAFAGRFRVGVLLPEAGRAVHARYGFRRWPAVVVLRDGEYVGAIDGLRDWGEYVEALDTLLAAPPVRPPSIGIPIAMAKP
ncbi:MAG: hydrogenase [Burkholderiales bacterium]